MHVALVRGESGPLINVSHTGCLILECTGAGITAPFSPDDDYKLDMEHMLPLSR